MTYSKLMRSPLSGSNALAGPYVEPGEQEEDDRDHHERDVLHIGWPLDQILPPNAYASPTITADCESFKLPSSSTKNASSVKSPRYSSRSLSAPAIRWSLVRVRVCAFWPISMNPPSSSSRYSKRPASAQFGLAWYFA